VKNLHISCSLTRNILLMSAIIFTLSFSYLNAQIKAPVNHAFHNAFVFGLEGGLTVPQTDYQSAKIGFSLRGAGEYFFKTNSIHLIGLKLKVGAEQVKGEDSRGSISSQDGRRDIPPSFTTNIFSAGLAATYAISIKDKFFPYVSGGISNIWFDPMDDQNNAAAFNALNFYEKTVIAFNVELGLKYLVSDKISINFSANQNIPNTDYLDDVAGAYGKDAYTSFLFGISYSPFTSAKPVAEEVEVKTETPVVVPEVVKETPVVKEEAPVIKEEKPPVKEETPVVKEETKVPETPVVKEEPKDKETTEQVPDNVIFFTDDKVILMCDDIFMPNSAVMLPEGKQYLDKVIPYLKKFTDKKWRIEGHMDSNGGKRFLRNLSLERAKSVLEYFNTTGGLKREDFQVFGMGDNFTIADSSTDEGRRLNRRIIIAPLE
jgi:outer membrane protein OmpA-like peptidoglycan-associated protein/opacity protein-like surface antigen